ncbi:MAG: tetratricopeptide repeat protein, partial [Terriglobales bacterium]
LYQRALKLEKDNDRALVGYAELQAAQGKNQDAEALYKKAIAVLEASLGPESMGVGDALEKYAAFLRSQNRVAEAARLEARVKKIREIGSEPN